MTRLEAFLQCLPDAYLEKLLQIVCGDPAAREWVQRWNAMTDKEKVAYLRQSAEECNASGDRDGVRKYLEWIKLYKPIRGTHYERELWRWENEPDVAARLEAMDYTKEQLLAAAMRNDEYCARMFGNRSSA